MTERYRVVITDYLTGDLAPEREILGDLADVEALNAFHEDELIGRIEDADAVMMYHCLAVSEKIIRRLTRCKLIVRCGVGVDNVDARAARQCDIPVANIPDYGTEEVADSAIAMTLALARGVAQLNSILRAGADSWKHTHVVPLERLRGEVFGIVGLGRIGTAAALRAKALGMDVVFYDPYKEDGYGKALGIRRTETLDALLRQAYVVSLHCPLTEETRHLINDRALAEMRTGTFLVNTSRGAVVDTALLPAALASGQLAGAGIDVLPSEPPPEDDPLIVAWRDPNHPAHHRLLINPHAAFYCEQGQLDMRVKGSQACRRALLGEPIRTIINEPVGKGN